MTVVYEAPPGFFCLLYSGHPAVPSHLPAQQVTSLALPSSFLVSFMITLLFSLWIPSLYPLCCTDIVIPSLSWASTGERWFILAFPASPVLATAFFSVRLFPQ